MSMRRIVVLPLLGAQRLEVLGEAIGAHVGVDPGGRKGGVAAGDLGGKRRLRADRRVLLRGGAGAGAGAKPLVKGKRQDRQRDAAGGQQAAEAAGEIEKSRARADEPGGDQRPMGGDVQAEKQG